VTRFQKFSFITVHRSQIKNAPYNPRFIDPQARTRLKKKIEKDGLIEGLVWNERTGNLVSGHQRLGIIDDLEGKQDYSLTVCRIDVTEKKEKELNVFLNNSSAQGSFDFDLVKNLLSEDGVKVEEFGFDNIEVKDITGIDIGEEFFNAPAAVATQKKIETIKERRKKMKEEGQKKDNVDFYLIAVFESSIHADALLDRLGLPKDNKYINGDIILSALGDKNA
jgi:hypothetical protein